MFLAFSLACAPADKPPAEDTAADTGAPDSADTDTGAGDTDSAAGDTDTSAVDDTADTDTGDDLSADVTIAVGTLGMSLRSLPDGDGDGRGALLIARQVITWNNCLDVGAGLPPPSTCMSCGEEDALYVLQGRPGATFSLVDDADRVLDGDGCVGVDPELADLDGDGVDEIVAGAPYSDRGGGYYDYMQNAGQIDIYPLSAGAPGPEPAVGGWVGDTDYGIGAQLVPLADMDGDGRDELATTANRMGWSGYLLLPGDSWSTGYPLVTDHPIEVGTAGGIAGGDIDGDGLTDLVFVGTGSELVVGVWHGGTGGMAIDAADADPFVEAEGFRYTRQAEIAVTEGDGDGYLDVFVDCTTTAGASVVVGAPGAAVGGGEVLQADGLVTLGDAEGLDFAVPTALRPGEADGAVVVASLRFGTDGVESASLLAFAASALAAGGHLGPEDGATIWLSDEYAPYHSGGFTADLDWDADGRPDFAFAAYGDQLHADHTSPEQAAMILLDP